MLQAALKKGLTAGARYALQAQRRARRDSAQAAVDDLQTKTAQVVEDLRRQQYMVGLETNLNRMSNSKAKPLIQAQKLMALLSEQLGAALRTLEAVLAENKAAITTDELEAYLRKARARPNRCCCVGPRGSARNRSHTHVRAPQPPAHACRQYPAPLDLLLPLLNVLPPPNRSLLSSTRPAS